MSDGAASGAVSSRFLSLQRISAPAALAALAIMVLALVLRILGARGELWLDELWSLRLIDDMARQGLLWGLATDNNHYLNTLYLWLVGADAPVLVQRALSILLGLVTVAIAGLAVRPASTAGFLAAMALFAVSYPMVNYASEARGYAGLILMTVVALLLIESAAVGSVSARRRLGLANLVGALFQPIMLGGIAAEMGWAAWLQRGGLLAKVKATAQTFSWSVRLLIPFAAVIVFAVLQSGGYRIAGSKPFSVSGFVEGFGGLLHLLLGLPEATSDWIALVIGAAAVAVAFKTNRKRAALYLVFMLGLPLAIFVARLPNVHFPRYYLAAGIVFLILLADLFALAWRKGGALRILGLVLLAAILAGNGFEVVRLLQDGRDQSGAMMRLIGAAGPALVTSDQDVRNQPVVEFLAQRLNLPVTYVPSTEICAQQPAWLISSADPQEMPQALDTSNVGCSKVFIKQATFPQWGLSGLPWTVYREAP